MRVTLSFNFTKDLSDLTHGEMLMEIMRSYGLVPTNAGDCQPIRESFEASDLPKYWKLLKSPGGETAKFYFLFRGKKEINFTGMVTCNTGLHTNTRTFNGATLWLNVRKTYDINKLVSLGDDLFIWSEANYGYITEEQKNIYNVFIQRKKYQESIFSVCDGIPGLMWLNYFGKPYLAEKGFRLPDGQVPVGHGARVRLSERPDDEVLGDLDYIKKHQEIIGSQWFCPIKKIENGVGYLPDTFIRSDIISPVFDRSEMIRKRDRPEDC